MSQSPDVLCYRGPVVLCYWSVMSHCRVTLTLLCSVFYVTESWCFVLQMCYRSAMAHCLVTLTLSCLMFNVTDLLLLYVTDVLIIYVTDVLMFYISTFVLLKCLCLLPSHADIVYSWCFMLKMPWYFVDVLTFFGYRFSDVLQISWCFMLRMSYSTCPGILSNRCPDVLHC